MFRVLSTALLLLCLQGITRAQQNVLILVADDVGVDRVESYRAHPRPGETRYIDELARSGVRFASAWACPLCSPTRATVLTGRHPFRTGVGSVIFQYRDTYALPFSELILPELLRDNAPTPYTSVALGKWHLATENQGGGYHPWLSGFDLHLGAVARLGGRANVGSYFQWQKSMNGQEITVSRYATTDTANDAIAMIQVLPEPWFLWVCFQAPHTPFHAPPAYLHHFPLQGDPSSSPAMHMKAMTEAMDLEIGRILATLTSSLRDRTTIIFMGDNGTDGVAVEAPARRDHAKGTLYEGGIRVPLIVSGPDVAHPGSVCQAPVQAADVFATVAELAEATIPANLQHDSVSLVPYLRDPHRQPLRRYAFSETFWPNGPGYHLFESRTVRDERYKLISRPWNWPPEEMYDLTVDPDESSDLLRGPLNQEQRDAHWRLRAQLARMR